MGIKVIGEDRGQAISRWCELVWTGVILTLYRIGRGQRVLGGEARDVLIGGDVNQNRKIIVPETSGHRWTHNRHSIAPGDL